MGCCPGIHLQTLSRKLETEHQTQTRMEACHVCKYISTCWRKKSTGSPSFAFPCKLHEWLRAGNPSLFLCFEQVCILKNAFGIFWLWELGFRLTRLGSKEISHRFGGNPSPTFGKCVTDFGKCVIDFEEIHHRGKSVTNFGEMRHRFWGKACAFFGKNMLRFWDKQVRFGEKLVRFGGNWLGFWIGLGQSSSLTALNAKHFWVWIFEVLGLGVTKNKSTAGKLEG